MKRQVRTSVVVTHLWRQVLWCAAERLRVDAMLHFFFTQTEVGDFYVAVFV